MALRLKQAVKGNLKVSLQLFSRLSPVFIFPVKIFGSLVQQLRVCGGRRLFLVTCPAFHMPFAHARVQCQLSARHCHS